MSFKSFLNWLQSDNSSAKGGPDNWTEKRRENRIEFESGKQILIHLMSEGPVGVATTLNAKVRDVSVRGCSLVFDSAAERNRLKAGQVLVAALEVESFSIPLQVEVVRLTGETGVAIRFKPPFPRELEKLEKFLEPRCLGRSLREIDRDKLQGAQQKGLRWFQGVNETHLFTWTDPATGTVTQQQLIFLDRVVEWKGDGPARSGLVRAEDREAQGHVEWVKSEMLDFDAAADPTTMGSARTILETAEIDEPLKQIFLKKLS